MDGSYQFYTLEFGTHRTARSVCGGYLTKFDPTRNSHWSGFIQGPACFQKLGGFGPFSTLFPSFFKDRTPDKKQTGGCHIDIRASFFQNCKLKIPRLQQEIHTWKRRFVEGPGTVDGLGEENLKLTSGSLTIKRCVHVL